MGGRAFDPEAVEAMGRAYDKACRSIHGSSQPDVIKEMIAKQIIAVASEGGRDPDELCALALASLGFGEIPSLAPSEPIPQGGRDAIMECQRRAAMRPASQS
jgi:hypothetical protein